MSGVNQGGGAHTAAQVAHLQGLAVERLGGSMRLRAFDVLLFLAGAAVDFAANLISAS